MLLVYYTVEPLYNEVLGTMKITLLCQVSRYIRVKKISLKVINTPAPQYFLTV